jgi:amino acid transporter
VSDVLPNAVEVMPAEAQSSAVAVLSPLEAAEGWERADGRLKRNIGALPLLFTGLSAMIGSGWLFGAQRAAALAGPSAILAWLIGESIILIIAVVAVELGTMFRVSGGLTRYPQCTHGALAALLASWANWLSIAGAIPLEAVASVQYLSTWHGSWTSSLIVAGTLSSNGLLLAAALIVVYFLLNYWGVKLFARSNAAITVFKLAVPTLSAVALIIASLTPAHFVGRPTTGFMPYGVSGLLTAVSTSGIVLSFNGFQSPLNLAGEARNARRTIPFAVIGSVIVGGLAYLLLQVAFLVAVGPDQLAHGWAGINMSSPFAELAVALNVNWLALLLYADAFVSPSGAGITDMATSSRMILGVELNGLAPRLLGRIDPVYGVPRPALWMNLVLAMLVLLVFRGWNALAALISVATALSYLMIPISAMSLRRTAAQLDRPFRARAMNVLGTAGFVLTGELLYWARWPLTIEIIGMMAAPLPVYFWYRRGQARVRLNSELRHARWLLLYLPALVVMSWAGSTEFGGHGWIPYGWDMAAVAVVSAAFCHWGASAGMTKPAVEELLMETMGSQ